MKPSVRRALWLRKRAKNGKDRPSPVKVIAGNCMSVSTGRDHAEAILEAYLKQATSREALVVGLTECADFQAAQVVARFNKDHGTRWKAYQFGKLGSPESGSALIINADQVGVVTEPRPVEGTPAGEGVRARTMVSGRLAFDAGTPRRWSAKVTAGHAPPSWAPRSRSAFIRRIATVGGIRLGDMNYARRALARLLPGITVRVVGVIAAMVPTWIPSSKATAIPENKLADADHAGVIVTLWP